MKARYSKLSLFNWKKLKALLSFGTKGYLADIGWIDSFDQQSSVDADGQPIPWVTYSFVDFIKDRISDQHLVFEYGSGSSTLFYAQRAKAVVSVEHDRGWLNRLMAQKPANSELIFADLEPNGAYSHMPNTTGKQYDMIIVDGRDRVNCCKNALPALKPNGVLVLDDSEREVYQPAVDFLKKSGFRELSFSGIAPGLFYYKSTSVFYKAENCLGI